MGALVHAPRKATPTWEEGVSSQNQGTGGRRGGGEGGRRERGREGGQRATKEENKTERERRRRRRRKKKKKKKKKERGEREGGIPERETTPAEARREVSHHLGGSCPCTKKSLILSKEN